MAFTGGVLLAAGLAGFGIAEVVGGFGDSPSKPPDQPALPNQNAADKTAANTVADQRRALLATGGQTDYTGGSAVLTDKDVSKNVLLGG